MPWNSAEFATLTANVYTSNTPFAGGVVFRELNLISIVPFTGIFVWAMPRNPKSARINAKIASFFMFLVVFDLGLSLFGVLFVFDSC